MDSSTVDATGSPAGQRERSSARLRERLIDAALVEFASHGFGGASTRSIAERAGAHQPQINYHFSSKAELWKAVLLKLLAELDDLIVIPPDASPRQAMEIVIRAIVEMAAVRPELNRIMVHEGTHPSARLEWLVDTQLRTRSRALVGVWEQLLASGEAAPISSDLVYHVLIGAASLLHANAPEARLMLDIEPSDPAVIQAHADALVAMFLPGKRRSR